MKPKDLLDAMDGISDAYITEAKPNAKRRGESRAKASETNADTKKAAPIVQHKSGSSHVQQRPVRKDSTMNTAISVWQRAATGIAAAAACTVFVGGAWFIAKQAKDNQPDTASSNELREGEVNFLGGYGDIHTAANLSLMYDDNNVYFQTASFQAARTGSEVSNMQSRQYLSNIYWDGEQYYRLEGNALYRIDMQGQHLDDKPFYTMDIDAIDPDEIRISTEITDSFFVGIRKLADDVYFINFSISTATDKAVNWDNRSLAYLYHPSTGQQDLILFDGIAAPDITPVDDNHAVVSDPYNNLFFRVTYEPLSIERTPDSKSLDRNRSTNWTVSGSDVYYMYESEIYLPAESIPTSSSYCKYNLDSQEITEILRYSEFTDFIPYDGKIYALYADGSKLVCADPEWKNVETIYDFSKDLTPDIADAFDKEAGGQYATPTLLAVDENYIEISYCFYTQHRGIALLDRKTGVLRFFTEQQITDNGDTAEIDVNANILGGYGEIHAAGNKWLLYDNDNVYFEYTTVKGDRNTNAPISGTVLNPVRYAQLVYDGKDLYYVMEDNSIHRLGSDGKPEAKAFYTVSDKDLADFKSNYGKEAYLSSCSIERLTDENYFIFVTLTDNPTAQLATANCTYSCCYNAVTGESTELPNYDDMVYPYDVISDGSAFYCKPLGVDGFCRVTLNPLNFEVFDGPDRTILCSQNDWMAQDGVLYFITPNDSISFSDVYYCSYDTASKAFKIIDNAPDFSEFIAYDGMIYALSKDGRQICCYDRELNKQSTLVDYEKSVPAEIQATAGSQTNEYGPVNPICKLDAVDENYLTAHLADGTYLLLDRKTGAFRFYSQPNYDSDTPAAAYTTTAKAADTASAATTTTTATDNGITTENIFAGSGNIIPLDLNTYGRVHIFRDDAFFYFCQYHGADLQWYRVPSGGGSSEPLPDRIMGAQTYSGELHSDGSSVYMDDLSVVTEGANGALHFNIKDAFAGLPNQSDSMGYRLMYIWHIDRRYFMVLESEDYTKPVDSPTALKQSYEISRIYVWTDENGNIIERRTLEGDRINGSFFCDEEREHIHALFEDSREDFPALVVLTGMNDDAIDGYDTSAFLEKGDYIRCCAISGGKLIYTTADKLCTLDEDGNHNVLVQDVRLDPNFLVTADGKIIFSRFNAFENYEYIESISAAGGEPTTIYSGDKESALELCGFTSSEAMHTPYYILAKINETFRIIDPTDGEVLREIR